MTIVVEPGQAGCFYQNLSDSEVIKIEYNVIDSTLGDLYVNFHLADPEGEMIVADFMRSENEHEYSVVHEGTYRFCFDNTVTNYNSKTVDFEILIRNKGQKQHDHDNEEMQLEDGEDAYSMRLQDIYESLSRIERNIIVAQQCQMYQAARGTRDKHIMEEMRYRVSSWSKSLIILMMLIGIIQVTIVKNLFKDRKVMQSSGERDRNVTQE
ncbi:unnamed protein product [Arctia plantaginis]|uniref:GOLD domain-containing protein n=1 Tax=Arctia plantaginis TaxID=874455 RepID=A0A8S0ZPQ8_ARCPL|nr:unnamed protein product [Arctia plantaginis]CAB3235153.1 unnamed protein product [Arctia plantaginis]